MGRVSVMDVRIRKLTTLDASSVLVLWDLKDRSEKRDCLSLSLLTAFLMRSPTLSGLSSSLNISQSYNFDTAEGTHQGWNVTPQSHNFRMAILIRWSDSRDVLSHACRTLGKWSGRCMNKYKKGVITCSVRHLE